VPHHNTEGGTDMPPIPDCLSMVTSADSVRGPGQGHWTYKDYAALPDDGRRYEVVEGTLFMAPSPSRWHQETVGELFAYLRDYIKMHELGRVYMAPFDVELANNIVVQPDVMVILNANREKVVENRVVGAPDLVVEVASPGTAGYDRREKQNIYAHSSVTEYWIADPSARTVEVLLLEFGEYRPLGVFHGKATLPSKVVAGFPTQVEQFFA